MVDGLVKSSLHSLFVIPAKAGIQLLQALLDSRFRGRDSYFDFLRVHHSSVYKLEKKIFLTGDLD